MQSLVFFLALLPLSALAIPVTAPSSGCADVGIITTRASTEAPGEGIIGALAALIQSHSNQTVSRASVDYPALLEPYGPSSAAGTAALTTQLTQAVQTCPDQKIVLLGYSQGAHVVGDVLGGGGGGLLGATTPPISQTIGSHVAAIVQMGDPRHRSDETYHVGTSTHSGLFPRAVNQELASLYTSKARTFCDAEDEFCDSGTSVAVHEGYTQEYDQNALAFVLGLIGG